MTEKSLTTTKRGNPMIRDVGTLRVQFDADRYNLLAPTVHMPGGIPAGTRLVVTEIAINPDPSKREVFPLPGGALLVGKPSLDRIAGAAGISWLEVRRQDDGKHPHYCEMYVRGKIRDFDGSVREVADAKAIDLREDAGQGIPGKDYDEIVSKAEKKGRDPSGQLMEARKFIQEIAASKATNRAIAKCLGIKRSYTRAELAKPFVVPKLSMDPTSAVVQQAVVADMLGDTAVRAMFGPGPEQKVVDAELDEPSASEPSGQDGGSAGDVNSTAPADPEPPSTAAADDDGPPPMSESAKPTEEQWRRRLGAAWKKASAVGLSAEEWPELIRNATGKHKESDLTFEDLDLVDAAVKAFA